MQLIDLHCDTIGKMLYGAMTQGEKLLRKIPYEPEKVNLMENSFCVSIPKMRKAGTLAQFFACFTFVGATEGGYDSCYEDALEMIRRLKLECAHFSDDLVITTSLREMLAHEKANQISAFLTVEEGGILNGEMDRLEHLYQEGVRLMTPLWNFENCFGAPNSDDPERMKQGLTKFGKEAVMRAGEMGMIIDVSHASDGSFWDILSCDRGPVIASHSNSREIHPHRRNLTDDMIRALALRGGVAGLNLYGLFLNGSDESRVQDMAKHALHMMNIGGEEFLSIGTDFDGFDGMSYQDVPTVSEMEVMWDGLHKGGITERQLDLIWRGNAQRIIGQL